MTRFQWRRPPRRARDPTWGCFSTSRTRSVFWRRRFSRSSSKGGDLCSWPFRCPRCCWCCRAGTCPSRPGGSSRRAGTGKRSTSCDRQSPKTSRDREAFPPPIQDSNRSDILSIVHSSFLFQSVISLVKIEIF